MASELMKLSRRTCFFELLIDYSDSLQPTSNGLQPNPSAGAPTKRPTR